MGGAAPSPGPLKGAGGAGSAVEYEDTTDWFYNSAGAAAVAGIRALALSPLCGLVEYPPGQFPD